MDAEKSTEISEQPKKPHHYAIKRIKDLNKTEKKGLIYNALTKEGFRPAEVAHMLGVGRSYVNALAKKQSQGLLAPLAAIARRSVKQLAKGQKVGEMESIRGSDVLGACTAILDRVDPKVNRQEIKSLHATIEISPEERAQIRERLGLSSVPQHLVSGPSEMIERQANIEE